MGSDRPVRIDARVLCATNLAAEQLRDPERFRQDLLYRINTIEIRIPPLRERRQRHPAARDPLRAVLRAQVRPPGAAHRQEAMSRLQHYPWPGNVRELKHAVERAVIMSDSGSFPLDGIMLPPAAGAAPEQGTLNLDELEKLAIQRALAQFQGNLTRAALALGLGRTTLYRKMARHGLQ